MDYDVCHDFILIGDLHSEDNIRPVVDGVISFKSGSRIVVLNLRFEGDEA